jgi:hypothetical protein
MTEKDLNNIKFLRLEIARADKLIKEMSGTGQSKSYVDLLYKTKCDLLRNKIELESLIHEIDNAEIRLILKLKFIDLRSWNYIARTMHYDRTTVYKKYKKFVRGTGNEQ